VKQLLESPAGAPALALMERDAEVATAIRTLLGEHAVASSSTEIAWAVRKLLESAADGRPLVVVFDDIHWGEPTLFDLIEHIADLSRGVPILVLCLGRPELLERRVGWGGGKLNATTVLLEPLNASETDALIDELIPAGSGIDQQLRERVRATAAGNPLFVEEIVAMVRESATHDVIVPPTIKALLAARFDQLRPEERDVLERGSVEGQSFHRGAVEVMAPDEHDVAGKLMTLVRKDLLRPDRAVFAGEDAFAFRHLLIRDAAYDSLPKASRAELHASFAGWLQQRGGDLEELDEITGYHLERAFRYRAELGPTDDDDHALASAAAGHLKTAGRRALDRGDTPAAVNLLERADALLTTHRVEPALEEALIQGLGMAGRLNEAVARADRAAALCAAAGDVVGEFRVRLASSTWRTNIDPSANEDGMLEILQQARPAIEADASPGAVAALEFAAGYLAHYHCRFEASLVSMLRCIDAASQAEDLWLARSAHALASAAYANGPRPVGEVLHWLKDQHAEGAGFMPLIDVWRASMLGCLGRFDEARSVFAATIDRMSERGMKTGVAIAMQEGWRRESLAGDLESAERVARLGCEQLEQLGERAWLSTQECQLGEALYALGRYDEAEERALLGLEMGGLTDVYTQVIGLQVRAKVLARRGDHDAALVLARGAEELAAATDAPLLQGDANVALAEVFHLAGDETNADAAIGRAVELFEQKGAPAFAAYARRVAATWDAAPAARP
jgi:tetratricopeptide (TPR) repeat protein